MRRFSRHEPCFVGKALFTNLDFCLMRRTKIIITLGPATCSPPALEQLMKLGVNVFRFNMSHAPHDWVRTVAKSIREISAGLGHEVALLLDTQGPAIRTGVVEKTYDLQIGDWVSFTVKGQKGTVAITGVLCLAARSSISSICTSVSDQCRWRKLGIPA